MNKYSPIISEFGSAEEEAAYDAWYRKKVQEALDDPRPSVPHDEAMARVRATLDRAKARAAKC
ncbi:MAG: stability determinant [Alteraurantiacibacter sp.]